MHWQIFAALYMFFLVYERFVVILAMELLKNY